MPEPNADTELAIVGGGMVGMALALSLAQNNISTVLLEASQPSDEQAEQFDDRTLVVNPASKSFWEGLGLWQEIDFHATAIEHVHVSNQGHFGVVQFDCHEIKVPHLGHVVAAKVLAQILLKAVQSHEMITYMQPAELTSFHQHDNHVSLQISHNGTETSIAAQLMVAADGAQSSIRSQLNLETQVKSYARKAIIANITTDQNHQNKAFERLTQEGPMALLPYKNRFGFVWSMHESQADEMLQIDDSIFLQKAQQQFGYRAGRFQNIGQRSSYPLYQIKVPTQFAQRVVLMGNAAHAVSPVSAQGLNLAVRGLSRLSQILNEQKLTGEDLGAAKVLQAYQDASEIDQQRTLNYTDDLMTWFKIDEPVVNAIRSLGLVAINGNSSLKRVLFETAGGLR